jgi:protein O-mannosyl-transferase
MSKRKRFSSRYAPQAQPGTFFFSALLVKTLAGPAIIAVAVFLAYFPSLNGGFLLDDDLYVTNTKVINASDGVYRIWCTTEPVDYWPLSNSTLWIEWRLWGMNSTGYHLTNLILHIVAAFLIWIILRKLSIPGAFLAAMIFALHPVNVQSVAWIAQRKNLTSMLFFLLSIVWFLKFVKLAPRPCFGRCPAAAKPSAIHHPLLSFSSFILHPSSFHLWYWLSLVAFILAMLSKGSATVLPAILLGIVWWLRPLTRWDLVRTAPFFLVAAVLSEVNVWFQTHGAAVAYRTVSFTDRLLGAGGVVWFYLYKALFPLNLVFVYPKWHIEAGNLLWWLPLAAVLVFTAVLWQYRKGWSRSLLFAWGFFCVALAPVLGFKDVGFMEHSLVADHYVHIAIIGVITLASAGFSAWDRHVCRKTRWATAVVIATVAALTFLTWRQSGLYRDAITIYKSILNKNPASWMAQNNLGIALDKAGRPEAAIKYYREALRLKPNYPEAHYNQGFALVELGRLPEAIEQYEQALALKSDYPRAQNNLGIVLHKMSRFPEAIEHFEQALRLEPNNAEAHNNLGIILYQTGRPEEAIEHYKQALQFQSNYDKAYYNLGNALRAVGQYQQAVENYRQALRLKPDYIEAHINLAATLVQAGRPEEAIEHYRQVLSLKPDSSETYFNLSLAYTAMSQSNEAVAMAQKALELARFHGQTALAKQIEDWLNFYRAGPKDRPNRPPASNSASPLP